MQKQQAKGKRIAPMWLTTQRVWHYNDYERAERVQEGRPSLVFVVMDADYVMTTWQRITDFDGHIYASEDEAEQAAHALEA